MSNVVKGALTAIAILGGLALLLVGAGFWFTGPSIAASKQGTAFGDGHDQMACESAALDRAAACGDGTRCLMSAAVFHATCLGSADPSVGYCNGVPAPDETGWEAWAKDACLEVQMEEDQACIAVKGVTAAICDTDALPTAPTPAAPAPAG